MFHCDTLAPRIDLAKVYLLQGWQCFHMKIKIKSLIFIENMKEKHSRIAEFFSTALMAQSAKTQQKYKINLSVSSTWDI